jgi:hypothetical protein
MAPDVLGDAETVEDLSARAGVGHHLSV